MVNFVYVAVSPPILGGPIKSGILDSVTHNKHELIAHEYLTKYMEIMYNVVISINSLINNLFAHFAHVYVSQTP